MINLIFPMFFSSLHLNSLSVVENITLYLDEKNIGLKEEKKIKANKISKMHRIRRFLKKKYHLIFGGMRKRAAIANND